MSENEFTGDETAAFDTKTIDDDQPNQGQPGVEPEDQGTSPVRDAVTAEESKPMIDNDIYDAVFVHGISAQSAARSSLDISAPFLRKALNGVGESIGRVLTWTYDTNIDSGKYYTPDGVYEEAEELLDFLIHSRKSKIKEARRPLYFFSHDIGGTLVKAALSIASKHGKKYADIFECTRAVYFFGYPHRCPNPSILQEAVLRLLAVEPVDWPGSTLHYARSLTDTILEVNDSFLQTQILTQANFVNVVSTVQDPGQQVFPISMSTMGTPFERVVKMESSHSNLIVEGTDGPHPVNEIADSDWLNGDLTDKQHIAFRKIVNLASPVFPYRKVDTSWQYPDLLDLQKVNKDYIVHMRCTGRAEEVSENASLFLDKHKKNIFHPLLFMKFDAYDVRFNNCEAMLRSFLARFTCNRLQSGDFVARDSRSITSVNYRDINPLFGRWEGLLNDNSSFRSGIHVLGCFDECDSSAIWFLSEIKDLLLRNELRVKILIITTKDSPGDLRIKSTLSDFPPENVKTMEYYTTNLPPFPINVESSKLVYQYWSFIGLTQRDKIRTILSTCAEDHHLCELTLKWLSSDREHIKHLPGLSRNPLTPGIMFTKILESIPESHREWAKIILAWLLASYRPLRTKELLHVSDLTWIRAHGSKTLPPTLLDIQNTFGGFFMLLNGETRFRHPDTRSWLCEQLNSDKTAWYSVTEVVCHEVILRTCIDHLKDTTTGTEDWACLLPYAIEFWSKHSQLVDGSEDLVLSLFKDEPIFQSWANALVEIPTRRLNPLPDHIRPLPMASHLGLITVVKALLEGHSNEETLLNQALIEACRASHVSLIRLLMNSKLFVLSLSNHAIHEAAAAVCDLGNEEAVLELVNLLPATFDHGSVQKIETGQQRSSYEAKEDLQRDHSMEDSPVEVQVVDNKTRQDQDESDPLQWLVMPMYRSAMAGMKDAVIKLLDLGVNPNTPKGITPDNNSYLHATASNSRCECTKLLIDAGALLTYENNSGKDVFNTAIAWSSDKIIQLLLENGAMVHKIGKNGDMPLDTAMLFGSFAAAKVILSFRDYHEYLVIDPENHPVDVAVDDGNYKCLELILHHGFSPNNTPSSGKTALKTAIENGRIDLCKLLLQHGADPDLTANGARTPLIQAVFENDLDMVKLLVECKAAIDKREMPPDAGWSRTPMHTAVDWKKPAIVQYLLGLGADPNACDSDGVPAIGAAADSGDPDVVQWLVDRGAIVNLTYHYRDTTPLHEAIPYPAVVRVLLRHGADITKTNSDSKTPLELAMFSNNLESVQIILEQCRDTLDLNTESTRQELCLAVVNGSTNVVGALLEAGADVNTVNEDGESLLMLGVKHNAESGMVCKILEYNPDVAARDNKQNTALHRINDYTVLETVRRIVNSGAKLDVLNDSEDTPLMLAIRAQLDDIFSYMIRKQPTLVNRGLALSNTILTPLHEACIKGSLFMVRSLISCKAEVNPCCEWLYGTPLVAATLRWRSASRNGLASDVIALLLFNGADPGIPSGIFRYPLISACLGSPADVIQLLLDSNASPADHDSLDRKPVHLACYNSLDVLNALNLPDSDFSSRDLIGRVPLHYAVMSGNIGLVQVVFERSERAGVDINVRDNDGWTPLLWAIRASRIWYRHENERISIIDVVSFLLENGADPDIKGKGVNQDWTVQEVAYYYHADSVISVMGRMSDGDVRSKKRGNELNGAKFCDCCLLDVYGIYYQCLLCSDYHLCHKCHMSALKVHPAHSSFTACGGEWIEHDEPEEEEVSVIDIGDGDGEADGDITLDLDAETPFDDFGDDDSNGEDLHDEDFAK
ncbi:hypothetical protein FSST1_010393 [Fusarium sambucinum]